MINNYTGMITNGTLIIKQHTIQTVYNTYRNNAINAYYYDYTKIQI